jgi:uncharacterized membrane protein
MEISRKRHILKTISYRIVSTSFGFIFMYYFTGDIQISGAFSLVEILWKPIQYYIHERLWYRIKFGVRK